MQDFPFIYSQFYFVMKVTQQLVVFNSWNLHKAPACATKFSEAYTKQSQAQSYSNIIWLLLLLLLLLF